MITDVIYKFIYIYRWQWGVFNILGCRNYYIDLIIRIITN